MTTTASTYTEARKISRPVTEAQAVQMLKDDSNPKVYRYRRAGRIAMDLVVYEGRFPFVGFNYCNRNGYTDSGTASLVEYVPGVGYRPTVFQSDRFGYFHTSDS